MRGPLTLNTGWWSGLSKFFSIAHLRSATRQNIAEFWNVWTRPAGRKGFGLDEISAEREIARFELVMELAADGLMVYGQWRELVLNYRVKGVQVHDARLVATMLVHRIPKLLTLNIHDFERYSEIIQPIHPASISR